MMDPKTDITDEEYHVTYGLHSGFPLCCVWEFAEGGKGGPCKRCREKGIEELPVPHRCNPANLSCQPYLDRVEQNAIGILEDYLAGQLVCFDDEQVHHTFITTTRRTLDDVSRQMLKDAGYRMAHLCYFEMVGVQHYKYIFMHNDSKEKAKCKKCKRKYSLGFPTVGFS